MMNGGRGDGEGIRQRAGTTKKKFWGFTESSGSGSCGVDDSVLTRPRGGEGIGVCGDGLGITGVDLSHDSCCNLLMAKLHAEVVVHHKAREAMPREEWVGGGVLGGGGVGVAT